MPDWFGNNPAISAMDSLRGKDSPTVFARAPLGVDLHANLTHRRLVVRFYVEINPRTKAVKVDSTGRRSTKLSDRFYVVFESFIRRPPIKRFARPVVQGPGYGLDLVLIPPRLVSAFGGILA